jgi:hypothetical protein
MEINHNELVWASGFLEGEGSFCCYPRCIKRNNNKGYYQLSVNATQANKEPLIRLALLFGGHVYGPYKKKNRPNNKPYYTWSIHTSLARKSMKSLLPLMSLVRQEQINQALALDAIKTRRPR